MIITLMLLAILAAVTGMLETQFAEFVQYTELVPVQNTVEVGA